MPQRAAWTEPGQNTNKYWGVAKLVKARDFDSRMRRFESYRPSHLELGSNEPLFVQSEGWIASVSGTCVPDTFQAPFGFAPKGQVGMVGKRLSS